MNEVASRKRLEYLEVVHRPSGKTVAYSCAWCGHLIDAQEDLNLAGGQIREHIDACEKKPMPKSDAP